MMTDFECLLRKIVEKPGLNARFANTLSLLEYIGTRKILKSQPQDAFTAQLLAHIAEEIRHAQLLKRLALRLSDGELETYEDRHLLCGPEARRYFQTIDHRAAEMTGPGGIHRDGGPKGVWSHYLYTTLLIEERASWAYPVYERLLEPLGLSGPIRSILNDEQNHLADVREHLSSPKAREDAPTPDREALSALRKMEEAAFLEWLSAVEAEISAQSRFEK